MNNNQMSQIEQWALVGGLEQQVIAWAEEKGIFEKSNPTKQFEKFKEEAEELNDEIIELTRLINVERYSHDDFNYQWEKLKLELGDVLVTLVLLAKMHDTSFAECLQLAYDKISKRTGKMIDGLFVKDDD